MADILKNSKREPTRPISLCTYSMPPVVYAVRA
nr:MAG TPA: hypothetical protein [Bacteriophage sp.]